MPLVRIDISRELPEPLGPAIGNVIYEAMTAIINVPKDDKFQIISRHADGELNVAPSYLGIEYSAGIVLIQITLSQGRSVELKKAFYRKVADGHLATARCNTPRLRSGRLKAPERQLRSPRCSSPR